MLNPAHILETAFLLLAAFLIGATIGSLARMLVLRTSRKPEAVVVRPAAEAKPTTAAEAPLVAAPHIEPVSKPVHEETPAEVPVPDFTEVVKQVEAPRPGTIAPMPELRMPTVAPLPTVETRAPANVMAPARAAGQSTSGKLVPSPLKAEPARPATPIDGAPSAEVIPFPLDRAAEPIPPADLPAADVPPAVAANGPEPATEPVAPTGMTATTADPAPASEVNPESEVVPDPASAGLVPEVKVEPPAAATAEDDEAAAMRAIEGSWTPKRSRPARSRRAAAPDGIEIEASPAPAKPEPPSEVLGRPAGIDAPRHGAKDNLTNVIGVLPIIETALNKVGIYHFDQVAELTDENVAWIEGHLGIAGRIGREHWREQARELAAVSEKARRVAGKP